jgi:hypothetical protein
VNNRNEIKQTYQKFVATKPVFTVTIAVTVLTILSIWLFGLGQNRTIFENSIMSTSILSIVFFLFITIGLYKGIKLKDDIGNITDNLKSTKIPNLADAASSADIIQIGEGLEGLILSIVNWIIMTILIIIFFWIFGAVVWTGIIVFIAMLYWIFFRALRLVFKKSIKCKDNMIRSIVYGLGYTTLYNFWIYGIILTTNFLIK